MARRIYRAVSVWGALVTDPYAASPLSLKLPRQHEYALQVLIQGLETAVCKETYQRDGISSILRNSRVFLCPAFYRAV